MSVRRGDNVIATDPRTMIMGLNITVSSFTNGFHKTLLPFGTGTFRLSFWTAPVENCVRVVLLLSRPREPNRRHQPTGTAQNASLPVVGGGLCTFRFRPRRLLDGLRRRRDPVAGHGNGVGSGPRDSDYRLLGVGQDYVVELYTYRTTQQKNRRHTEWIRRG